jgi:hypothetical protein
LRLGSFNRFHASSGGKATGLDQLVDQLWEDGREVGDVGDGVVDLALVERPARPVRETRALVEIVSEHTLDQVRIADLLAIAERHRRDLRVEQRVGHLAGKIVDDLQILSAGMEDLQYVIVPDHQFEQRLEIDIVGLRIDRRSLVGAGDLDEAQVRPIAVLTHELGVDRDEVVAFHSGDEGGEVVSGTDKRVNFHLCAAHSEPRAP